MGLIGRVIKKFPETAEKIWKALQKPPITGLLRNSPWVSYVDQWHPEFVYLITKSDKISSNVPDSFSRDSAVFEFRNSPITSIWRSRFAGGGKPSQTSCIWPIIF